MNKPFLTVPEAAERLCVSRRGMYNLINRGEIPFTTIGHVTRIPSDALEAWIREKNQEALAAVRK